MPDRNYPSVIFREAIFYKLPVLLDPPCVDLCRGTEV